MKKYELLQDYNTPDIQIKKGTIGDNKTFLEMFDYIFYYETCDLAKEYPEWFRYEKEKEYPTMTAIGSSNYSK